MKTTRITVFQIDLPLSESYFLNQVMDVTLPGHAYVKSPSDMACWDILGQATGLPMKLDENAHDAGSLLEGHGAGCMDAVTLKLSKFGGLSATCKARDLCLLSGRGHPGAGIYELL